MEITEIYVKRGRHLYNLHNDSGGFVGQFETLLDAALVARYVGCCDMNEEERAQAIAAMKRKKAAGAAEQAETAI